MKDYMNSQNCASERIELLIMISRKHDLKVLTDLHVLNPPIRKKWSCMPSFWLLAVCVGEYDPR
jgi:hypothetical protein